MRVLVIAGLAESLLNFRGPLLGAMVARGLEVHVAAPDLPEGCTLRKQLEERGLKVHDTPLRRTGTNPLADLYALWALRGLMRRIRPDVVLGYTIKPVIYGTLAAWLAGVPRRFAMVEGLGFLFTSAGGALTHRFLKRLVLWLYRLGLSRAERVIFLNPDDMAELVAVGVLPASKGFLLGGIGVDLAHWVPVPPVLNPPTFTMVARLLREKGVEEFAAAARIVKYAYPQARFVMLGGLDSNPGKITEATVKAWATEGILEWPGHTSVQPWLAQTSVFVLPSYREGVPASTQEAMAMARAVITTDVPGCRETVVVGVNGFMVPPRDVQALADKMQVFIEQPDLIATMGSASRKLAEERFDVHKVNQRLLNLLFPNAQRGGGR